MVQHRSCIWLLCGIWCWHMAPIMIDALGWSVLTAIVIAVHKGVFWMMTNNILEVIL